jgi:REP element-mobilizing transposase RayT
MTLPRQVLPGATYLVTRRCAQQEFLLKPTPLTTALFKYILAVAARRYGILLHAACVMSNHYHLVLTDPGAELPRFAQLLDSLLARTINASYGRWEAFWAPSSYSAVRLVAPGDVLDKMVYTLANPVSAGLVAHGREWPGLWSAPERIGLGGELAQRPGHFFSDTGSMPDREALVFSVPPCFPSGEAFREELQASLATREREEADRLHARGRSFMGAPQVMRQSRSTRPPSGGPRRQLRPRIAARDKWRRMEALARLEGFLKAYREALAKLRSGARAVVFPRGTYLLRVHLGVACEAA